MASIVLRKHTLTIQKQLEDLAARLELEAEDTDIKVVILRIVEFSLDNRGLFTTSKKSTNDSGEKEGKSDKEYQCKVDGYIKTDLLEWAKERYELSSDGKSKTKKNKDNKDKLPVDKKSKKPMRVGELLEKQVRYVMICFFSNGLHESAFRNGSN